MSTLRWGRRIKPPDQIQGDCRARTRRPRRCCHIHLHQRRPHRRGPAHLCRDLGAAPRV